MKGISLFCKRLAPPILGAVAVLLAMCYIGLELLPGLGKLPAFLCVIAIIALGAVYIRSVLRENEQLQARAAEAAEHPVEDTRDIPALQQQAAAELKRFWLWYAVFIVMAALLALFAGAAHKVDTWFTLFALISFILLWGFFAWLIPVGLATEKLDILTEEENPGLHKLLKEVFPGEQLMLLRDNSGTVGAQVVGKELVIYTDARVPELLSEEELKQLLLRERTCVSLSRSTPFGKVAELLSFRMKPTNISPLLGAAAFLMAPGLSRLTNFYNGAKATFRTRAEEQAAEVIAAEGNPEALETALAKLEELK